MVVGRVRVFGGRCDMVTYFFVNGLYLSKGCLLMILYTKTYIYFDSAN